MLQAPSLPVGGEELLPKGYLRLHRRYQLIAIATYLRLRLRYQLVVVATYLQLRFRFMGSDCRGGARGECVKLRKQ